ncbi:hypothetical protein SAMN04487949_0035 [Halogranum gelatinilyticum]|uniref:DUF7979 domain-containing protein n=1 Tax=Halogranum gelatinilyticum TaxID=660521 RepID=A0A1G9NPI2_9EURY|nr:hypothetical protein [Halogranum gelatinilyticum]SDL87915.1 hypothetical protein SAMN04487949_0035 [Halogranum gelatinilyticum]
MRPPPRPSRRTVVGFLGSVAAGFAGCLGPAAPTDRSSPTAESPTDSSTTTSLPPGVVAYDSLSDRHQRVVEEAVLRERTAVQYETMKKLREYDAILYEGTQYEPQFDWIVTYSIRPDEVDCAEAEGNETLTYANLSAEGQAAFDSALEDGSYEARDYEFPDELEPSGGNEEYVRKENTCYWLYGLHSDTSMYEFVLEPVAE